MRPDDDTQLQSLLRTYVYGTDPLVDALATFAAETGKRLEDAEAALAEIEAKPYRAEEVIARYRRESQ